MANSITLIGTSHLDPRGSRRLATLLDFLAPDTVAVEIDDARVANMCRGEQEFVARTEAFIAAYPGSDPATVDWVVRNFGYEYRVSEGYCARNGARIAYVDDPLENHPNALDIDVGRLLAMPLAQLHDIGGDYDARQKVSDRNLPWVKARDILLEESLRELPGRVCFVGGMAHSFGDYHNIYDRLSDSDAARYALNIVGSPNWMTKVVERLPLKW